MEIGVTKAVQDKIKTKSVEITKNTPLVFCWDTHLVKLKGRNVLLIVNASNRYTIAMTDVELRNWNYYILYVGRVIRGVMQNMGYSQEQIDEYLNRDICQPEGFEAFGYPSELFQLDMERIGILLKRKPAKIIDFQLYMENKHSTTD